ncbi:hypothetical protein, partial [Terrabacter aerolatus]|uniref:hypothetical protein n=1 Tax=Terrabacter aerolatus TaxID=422442 RepID=UPI0031D41349
YVHDRDELGDRATPLSGTQLRVFVGDPNAVANDGDFIHQDGGMRRSSLDVWSRSATLAEVTARGQRTADDVTGRLG